MSPPLVVPMKQRKNDLSTPAVQFPVRPRRSEGSPAVASVTRRCYKFYNPMDHPKIMNKRLVILLVLVAVFAAGCVHMTVRHLKRQPWVLEQPQELSTKFWRFEYQVVPMRDRFGVRGVAYPLESMPGWADWIRDLWMAVYLADENSHVIADDIRVFIPQELDRDKGLRFEFILKPNDLGAGGKLYLSFGYRMVLAKGPADSSEEGQESEVFFASEGALSQ